MRSQRHIVLPLVASMILGIVLALATLALAAVPGNSAGPLHAGPLADALGAFRNARLAAASDSVGHRAQHFFAPPSGFAPTSENDPGPIRIGQGKKLMTGLGVRDATLYAWPTTKGHVCFYLADLAGTCPSRLTARLPVGAAVIDPDALGSGEPMIVMGLVTDDVSSVEVRAGGTASLARLANNAFFHEIDPEVRAVDAVTVHYRNGTSRSLEFPDPPA